MLLRSILMIVIGISSGVVVAGGVFTVLIAVGLIPRFAGKMHIASRVFLLEELVICGTIAGSFLSVYGDYSHIGTYVNQMQLFGEQSTWGIWNGIGTVCLILVGLFTGIFVGCLAISIAEMLNSIPIFSRRIGFRKGLGIAILMMALGKLAGSIVYFTQGVWRNGQ